MFINLNKTRKGILQIACSSFFTVLMGVFVKLLNHSVPSSNLLFYRSVVQGILCMFVAKVSGINPIGPSQHFKLLNLRGLLGGIQIYLYFLTMQFLPISMATALFMTTPIYTLVLGAVFLKEQISKTKISAVFISIIGIVMVSHPNTWSSNPHDLYGSLCAIGEAISTAFIIIVIKKIGDVHYSILVFYLSAFMFVLGLGLSLSTGFASMTFNQLILVLLCCISAFLGQALLNAGVQSVSSVTSMTVRSLDVVFAFLFSIVLGDEILFLSVVGACFVLLGSYIVASQPSQELISQPKPYVELQEEEYFIKSVVNTDLPELQQKTLK